MTIVRNSNVDLFDLPARRGDELLYLLPGPAARLPFRLEVGLSGDKYSTHN